MADLGVAALCAALAGFWLARKLDSSAPQLASGTWLPQARQVADFQLSTTPAQPFSAAQLQGRPSLVFFGFTHCPDVCPTTLAKLAQVKKTGALPDLRVLLISIDPQRDTPPVLSQYVHAFDPQFIGLTGDTAAIGKVAADFGVAVQRVELPGGDYTMDHSATVFLLDNHAREVAVFTPPFDAKQIAQDLRTAAPDLQQERLMRDALFIALQKLLPQHFLSRLVLRLTRVPLAAGQEHAHLCVPAQLPTRHERSGRSPMRSAIASFNEFFTRALARRRASGGSNSQVIVSPVDGTVSQIGSLDGLADPAGQGTFLHARGAARCLSSRRRLGRSDSAAAASRPSTSRLITTIASTCR